MAVKLSNGITREKEVAEKDKRAKERNKLQYFGDRMQYALAPKMNKYSLNEPNSFFVKILRAFFYVDSILPKGILALMFYGEEFKKMLYDSNRYNYDQSSLSDSEVQHFLENNKIKENPIKEIESRLNIAEIYRFSLYKNQLKVMEAFNFGEKEIHKKYIDAVITEHSKDIEWIPDIATEIGEYHKSEIFQIFNSLSFDAKKQLLEKINTSVITDEELKQKIENIKNCNTEEEFNIGLKALYQSSFKEINGANILLGLCDVGLFEELTKREFMQKLREENKHVSSQKTILATALNKNTHFEIHSPKGIATKNCMKLAYMKNNITPEQFKQECSKNPSLVKTIWSSEGNTYTDYERNQSIVSIANTKDVVDTFLHEGTHANLASLFQLGHLNFFPDDNKKIEQKLYKKINQNLEKLDSDFKKILNSKTANTKDFLHALGIIVENKEEAREFIDFANDLDKFFNHQAIGTLKNPYFNINNPFLRLKHIMNNENFEKYTNIHAKTVHKIAEFLEKDDFKNSEIKNKDIVKLIENVYLIPTLNPIYANEGEKVILEESVVRINENRKSLSKVLPNSKSLNKLLYNVDRMEELIYFQSKNTANKENIYHKEMDIHLLSEHINPSTASIDNLKGKTGNLHKFENTFSKNYEAKEKAPPQSTYSLTHRLGLAGSGHVMRSRDAKI